MVQTLNEFAALSDYVLPGEAEGELLCGDQDPRKIGQFYLERGAKAVVTKMGKPGSVFDDGAGSGACTGIFD